MPMIDRFQDRHASGQQLAVFSSLTWAFQQVAEAAAALQHFAGIARCHLTSMSAKPAEAMPVVCDVASREAMLSHTGVLARRR